MYKQFWNFFYFNFIKIRSIVFFLFFNLSNPNQMSIFLRRNRQLSIIWKSKPDLVFEGQKYWIVYQSGKFSLSRKFRVDNSECHTITITEKGSKLPKWSFFIQCSLAYLGVQNSNPMSSSSAVTGKPFVIQKKKNSGLSRVSIRRQGKVKRGKCNRWSAKELHLSHAACIRRFTLVRKDY